MFPYLRVRAEGVHGSPRDQDIAYLDTKSLPDRYMGVEIEKMVVIMEPAFPIPRLNRISHRACNAKRAENDHGVQGKAD
jgi:hypothetical protein